MNRLHFRLWKTYANKRIVTNNKNNNNLRFAHDKQSKEKIRSNKETQNDPKVKTDNEISLREIG